MDLGLEIDKKEASCSSLCRTSPPVEEELGSTSIETTLDQGAIPRLRVRFLKESLQQHLTPLKGRDVQVPFSKKEPYRQNPTI